MERTIITSLVSDGCKIIGAVGLRTDNMEVVGILANATILATGGSGELYPYTLMPTGSSGYGVSLGLRAGAELVDMEFVQFYPTMIMEEGLPKLFVNYPPLLKFGADIVDENGTSIFKKHGIDESYKLTRDNFSILMAREMAEGRSLYLDCKSVRDEDISSNSLLASAIINLEAKHVPVRARKVRVAPYAHFFMGGLRTDANGATNIPGLFAAGEAMGGVHGANRIGGNAFAACLVFGFRAGMEASLYSSTVDTTDEALLKVQASKVVETLNIEGEKDANDAKATIQSSMWEGAGIVRDRKGLERVLATLNGLRNGKLSSKNPSDKLLVPMMLDNAEAIALSAMIREESRGAHYRTDFPESKDNWNKRIVLKIHEGECNISYILP